MMTTIREDLKNLLKGYYIKGLTIKKVNKHPKAAKIEANVFKEMRKHMPKMEVTKKMKDLIECSSYLYPTIKNEDNITWEVIFYGFLFLLDDHLDDNPTEYTKWTDYLSGTTTCPGDNDLERYFILVRDSGKTLLRNDEGYKDMMNCCVKWLKLYPVVQKYKDGPDLIDDDKLIELRQIDGAVPTAWILFELDAGLHPNKKFRENENWKLFNKAAGSHYMIVNDLFSFPREVENGQARYNAVFMKIKNNNLGVSQAIEALVKEAERAAETAHKLGAKLKALNNGKVNEYVDAGIACMYGNLYWSATCHRYHYGFPNFVDDRMLTD